MADPIVLEFEYKPEDIREALHWQQLRQLRASHALRGLIGWLIFVALAAILFIWLKTRSVSVSPNRWQAPPSPSQSLQDSFSWWLPAFLIVAGIVLVFVARRRKHLPVWNRYVNLRQQQKLVFDDEGIRSSTVFVDSLFRWPFFIRWGETKNLLIAAMPGELRLIIPKRAVGEAGQLERLRDILRTNVRESAGGFPVGPPKPVVSLQPSADPPLQEGSL